MGGFRQYAAGFNLATSGSFSCHSDFKDPPSRPRTGANPGQTPNEHPNLLAGAANGDGRGPRPRGMPGCGGPLVRLTGWTARLGQGISRVPVAGGERTRGGHGTTPAQRYARSSPAPARREGRPSRAGRHGGGVEEVFKRHCWNVQADACWGAWAGGCLFGLTFPRGGGGLRPQPVPVLPASGSAPAPGDLQDHTVGGGLHSRITSHPLNGRSSTRVRASGWSHISRRPSGSSSAFRRRGRGFHPV